jgi:hypothetical protein
MESTIKINPKMVLSKHMMKALRQYHKECRRNACGIFTPIRQYMTQIHESIPGGFNVASTYFGFANATDIGTVVLPEYYQAIPMVASWPYNANFEQLMSERLAVANYYSNLEAIQSAHFLDRRSFYQFEQYRSAFEEACYKLRMLTDPELFVLMCNIFMERILTPIINMMSDNNFEKVQVCLYREYREYLQNMVVDAPRWNKHEMRERNFTNFFNAFDIFNYLLSYQFCDDTVNERTKSHFETIQVFYATHYNQIANPNDSVHDHELYSQGHEEALLAYLQSVTDAFLQIDTVHSELYLALLDRDLFQTILNTLDLYVRLFTLYVRFVCENLVKVGREHFSAEDTALIEGTLLMLYDVNNRCKRCVFFQFQQEVKNTTDFIYLGPQNDNLRHRLPKIAEISHRVRLIAERVTPSGEVTNFEDVQKELDNGYEASLADKCAICQTNTRHYILVPCGHLVFCEVCLRAFVDNYCDNENKRRARPQDVEEYRHILSKMTCPMCRTPIDNAVRVIF